MGAYNLLFLISENTKDVSLKHITFSGTFWIASSISVIEYYVWYVIYLEKSSLLHFVYALAEFILRQTDTHDTGVTSSTEKRFYSGQ